MQASVHVLRKHQSPAIHHSLFSPDLDKLEHYSKHIEFTSIDFLLFDDTQGHNFRYEMYTSLTTPSGHMIVPPPRVGVIQNNGPLTPGLRGPKLEWKFIEGEIGDSAQRIIREHNASSDSLEQKWRKWGVVVRIQFASLLPAKA